VTFLQELTAFTVINLRANEPQKLSDLSPALGLDLVLNGLSKPMMALVSYFSVFNIWYIIVLSLGLSFLSGCAKSKAFLATIPNWLLPLGIALGVAALGQ
jgi:uncharacterized membrane protein YfhO